MERETSQGMSLGAVLLFLAIILGVGITVFNIAKGIMNSGVTKTQTTVAQLSESEFTDFDQKVVTGTQVQSAFRNFQGADVAVCVATTQCIDTSTAKFKDAKGIKDAYGKLIDNVTATETTGKNANFVKDVYLFATNNGVVERGDAYKVNGGVAKDTPLHVINYGAVLDTLGNPSDNANALMFREGSFYCQGGFAVDSNSNLVRNDITKNFTKTGMLEYISNTSKFNSYVIKDANGTYCGVVFVQIST